MTYTIEKVNPKKKVNEKKRLEELKKNTKLEIYGNYKSKLNKNNKN